MRDVKTIQSSFVAWQALTRICAETGETRTRALERIVMAEEARQQTDIDQKLLDWITTYTRLEIDGPAHRALAVLVKGND